MAGYRWNKKSTVDGCKLITTTFLKNQNYFHYGKWGSLKWVTANGAMFGAVAFFIRIDGPLGKIRFQYAYCDPDSEEKTNLDYSVDLQATTCHFGGQRWWFLCPLMSNGNPCGRRVGRLYLENGKYFGCRYCCNLTYESCQKSDKRVSAYLKNPEMLANPGRFGGTLIAYKASARLERKIKKGGL